MRFLELPLSPAKIVELDAHADDRGYFAKLWDAQIMASAGVLPTVAEWAISHNDLRGTVRGLHYQESPFEQAKLISCLRGAFFDVFVDLRPNSPTRHKIHSVELRADSHRMIYLPPGFAHGFQTLEDATVVGYMLSRPREAKAERGIRWNDAKLNIPWPLPVSKISDRDREFPGL
jgi:dTDP-4-dehydrorhamnose 3,5-epimerase